MTFGSGVLRAGSTGDGVGELQRWLVDRGFLIGGATPTGVFDQATANAVKAFQFSAAVEVDGLVGEGTRTAADGFAGTAATSGWHPWAVRDIQQDRSGGSFTTSSRRGVLHTTEMPSEALPAFDNPPHFTIGRDGAGTPVSVWQHYPVTLAAKALKRSDTVQTNRHGAIQIEIIGRAANAPGLATADPELFQGLGRLMRWIETATGVDRVAHHAFAGESAYGAEGAVRLSDAAWEDSSGWLGHQHVPAPNVHWDPGLIDVAGLLAVEPEAGAPAPLVPGAEELAYTAAPVSGPNSHPWIRATTRRLTNSFPSLTFALDCAGLPYYEVVLTTDHTLFAPEHSARRTPENFYAGRQDGLRSSSQAPGRYVAPVPVIRAFADAAPPGGQIYYTLVGYADRSGAGALPAADPVALARSAPSVAMAPGFAGHTLTESLGVPLGMLRPGARQAAAAFARVAERRAPLLAHGGPPRPPDTPVRATAVPTRPDPATDRAEGEDGYDYRMSVSSPVPDIPPELRPPPGTTPAPSAQAAADPADYEDGWGEWSEFADRSDTLQDEPAALQGVESPAYAAEDEYDELAAGSRLSAPPVADPAVVGAPADWRPPLPLLTPAQKRDVVEAFVGPDRELYAAVDPDGEYVGRAGTDHPAYRRHHLGLSFGLGGFSQDSGELGQLLALLRGRDADRFAVLFGPASDELLAVTNRPGPLSRDVEGGRSVRVQPVDGADLWEEPWLSRFAAAGAERVCRSAQIELAAGLYLDPVVRFAADLGLATERGLAMIFDRVAHRGVTGGLAWVIETVGPLQTPVLLQAALTGLGFEDVESFQRSQPDLLVDQQFGSLTHAALAGAIRGRPDLAPGTPVPVLSYRQMVDALARRATGQPWGDRMIRLSLDTGVGDELPLGDQAV